MVIKMNKLQNVYAIVPGSRSDKLLQFTSTRATGQLPVGRHRHWSKSKPELNRLSKHNFSGLSFMQKGRQAPQFHLCLNHMPKPQRSTPLG